MIAARQSEDNPGLEWWMRPVPALVLAALVAAVWTGVLLMIRMPGRSHRGPLPPLTAEERALAGRLRGHVTHLAGDIGERNVWRYDSLRAAATYIETALGSMGYATARQEFDIMERRVANLEAVRHGAGHAGEIVVVGAHYDSVMGCPGANDNATGVAAMLELARAAARRTPARTVRFVAFVNEEPPFFQTRQMGSLVYARQARARGDRIVAMLSLETIGYYSDMAGSQRYPLPFGLLYPRQGDFVAFVGNVASRALVRQAIGAFRHGTAFPSEGAAVPGWITGIGWSDHWAFWQQGWPGVMVTDTALFRDPHYHLASDTPERLDYERLARVVAGLDRVVAAIADGGG
jgi:hypothetical protein